MEFKEFWTQYLVIPISYLIIIAISYIVIYSGGCDGWNCLGYAIIIMFTIVALALSIIFSIINKFVMKWELNWWKNLVLFITFLILAFVLLMGYIRLTA